MQISLLYIFKWKQFLHYFSFTTLLCTLGSCKNSSKQNTGEKLMGRWQITEYCIPGLPPEDTGITTTIHQISNSKEKFGYMNFKPAGQLEISLMEQSEILHYRVYGDTIMINNRYNEPNDPMLICFEGNDSTRMTDFGGNNVYLLKRK